MWIKQVSIDGFKSYATRTVIADWDSKFTAITGLNGSGKSNILDAICFVLGIQNLSQVRVQNLQQLVYKEGQARVTKASVSLVFDNSDKEAAPIGYEEYDEITITRQVVIGGRNKYLINGQTALASRVRDLFHSVQLDVNNPHFLIMQGRITKVLNMKPVEILGMIQEAAGTKMYENKKASAVKTMEKKQVKVDEINRILEEDITPQLEKLRKEKTHYIQWTRNNHEMDRLKRLMIAYEFMTNFQKVETGAVAVQEKQDELKEAGAQSEFLRDEIEKLQNEIAVKEDQRGRLEESGYKEICDEYNNANKALKALEQKVKNQQSDIASEHKECKSLQNNLLKTGESLTAKNQEEKECEQRFGSIDERYDYLENRIQTLEAQQLGISARDGDKESGSLAQQLMTARRQVKECESEVSRINKRSKQIDKEVKRHQKDAKAHDTQFKKMQTDSTRKTQELETLKQQIQDMNVDEKSEEDLERKMGGDREALEQLRYEVRDLHQTVTRFDFDFRTPSRNFDRNCVHGKVAKLIQVRDPQFNRALEVVAGGRLYNVVIDTNTAAKEILSNGGLKERVTILPLNQIQIHPISKNTAQTAKRLVGEDECYVALELVGCPQEVERAIEYVFGSTFVCSNMETAKKVAFDPNIRSRAVTIEGEDFNPAGQLKGGSHSRGATKLQQLSVYADKVRQMEELQRSIQQNEAQLRELQQNSRKAGSLSDRAEILEQQINGLKSRMDDSAYAGVQQQIDALTAESNDLKVEKQTATDRLALLHTQCNDLQKDMQDYEGSRKEQEKKVKSEISKCKAEMKKLDKNKKESQQTKIRIAQEIDDLKSETDQLTQSIEASEQNITQLEEAMETLRAEVAQKKEEKKESELRVKAEREKLRNADEELKKLNASMKSQQKALDKHEIEIVKLKNFVKKAEESFKHAQRTVDRMSSEHDWIDKDKEEFGVQGGNYDFTKYNPHDVSKRLNTLKDEQSTLRTRINHKVMSMFERAENEYRDLIKKREIVREDKKKIENVITELDKKKADTLQRTWVKVNDYFNNIFGKVLPGTKCCLRPPEGGSVLDGLEVRVAFGDVWKASLSELSGGQRSLLALSLILSLLLFKPAPMYILDEIDAALDLSHTQNIGLMIKQYFSSSQFIVVSLKEGMFQNANVIFRTKFVDGISTVGRTAGSGANNSSAAQRRR